MFNNEKRLSLGVIVPLEIVCPKKSTLVLNKLHFVGCNFTLARSSALKTSVKSNKC